MFGGILTIIIGIVCIIIGIINKKGNISMLHSYHINNIKEEDKKPFSKLIGTGMIIVGITLVIYGALMIPSIVLENDMYNNIGNIVAIIGLLVGLVITLYAIKKYNKKITEMTAEEIYPELLGIKILVACKL